MCLNQSYCSLDEIEAGLGEVCVTTVGGELIPRNHLRHGEEFIANHHEKTPLPDFFLLRAQHFWT